MIHLNLRVLKLFLSKSQNYLRTKMFDFTVFTHHLGQRLTDKLIVLWLQTFW